MCCEEAEAGMKVASMQEAEKQFLIEYSLRYSSRLIRSKIQVRTRNLAQADRTVCDSESLRCGTLEMPAFAIPVGVDWLQDDRIQGKKR